MDKFQAEAAAKARGPAFVGFGERHRGRPIQGQIKDRIRRIARDARRRDQEADCRSPGEHIKVVVDKGWVTLEGQVEWNYQRDEAERAVRRISGVKGVINSIGLEAAGQAERNQAEDRGSFPAERRDRRKAGSRWKRTAVMSSSEAPYGLGRSARRPNGPPGRRLG